MVCVGGIAATGDPAGGDTEGYRRTEARLSPLTPSSSRK